MVSAALVGVGSVTVSVGGGVYGPDDGELRHWLPPPAFLARTPTMYVFSLSASISMLVEAWSSAANCQLCVPSSV